MKRIFMLTIFIILAASTLYAQDFPDLQSLKRPRYDATPQQETTHKTIAKKEKTPEPQEKTNSRFAGIFKGKVTVHYKGKMVRSDATLTIASGTDENKSHYDFYVLPSKGNYLESKWEIDKSEVHRSATISKHTVYITDIIEYPDGGGNSQIRTLVFSEDHSALTFLKTEFDDASRNSATGQIIGRFIRIEK